MREAFLAFIDQNMNDLKHSMTLLAVSGGVDSSTLAHLFHQCGFAFGIAHCNFGLRGSDSDEDDLFVANMAKNYDVPFHHIKFETTAFAKSKGISIQMAARELRYDFFRQLLGEKYKHLAIAHHQDDQFETVLFNLVKGTGIKGLTGWPARKKNVVRPLLFAKREEVVAFANEEGIKWREDVSNKKIDYTRNKIRHQIIPKIIEINAGYLDTYKKTKVRLEETSQTLEAQLSDALTKAVNYEGDDLTIQIAEIEENPAPSQLLFYVLKPLGFNFPQCLEMAHALHSTGKLFFGDNYTANIDREFIYVSKNFEENMATSLDDVSLHALKTGDSLEFETIPNHTSIDLSSEDQLCELVDKQKMVFPLILRAPTDGDYFYPLGLNGKKKVSEFMIDLKIPLNLKKRVLLVESQGEIVWVIGHRIDNRFKITPETSEILKMTYSNAPQSI